MVSQQAIIQKRREELAGDEFMWQTVGGLARFKWASWKTCLTGHESHHSTASQKGFSWRKSAISVVFLWSFVTREHAPYLIAKLISLQNLTKGCIDHLISPFNTIKRTLPFQSKSGHRHREENTLDAETMRVRLVQSHSAATMNSDRTQYSRGNYVYMLIWEPPVFYCFLFIWLFVCWEGAAVAVETSILPARLIIKMLNDLHGFPAEEMRR